MKKMWKRFVSLLLACTLLAGMLPLSASAAEKPTNNKWVQEKVEALNAELGDESHQYELDGWAPIPGSDLFAGFYTRSYFTADEGKVSTTVMFIAPGDGGSNFAMPDYSQVGDLWVDSGSVALYIANGVTEIGNHAFDGMSTLETIEFENSKSLTKVGEYAFNNCDKMVGLSLDLSNVTTLGKYAFNGCERLGSGENNKGVTLSDELTTIPENAFNTCGLKNVNIPKSCTKIEKNAFAHNSLSEVKELVLPDGLQTIGESAFVVTMGSGETGIGITSLTIPSSVESIGANAFSGRRNLAEVTVEDDNVPNTELELGNAAFGFNESSAFSEWGSITDDRTGQKYEGTMGTKFYLPADLTEKFINGTNCYTGDIEPMKWVKTQQPTCDTDGYHLYETTKKGAYDDEGKPLVLQYKYTIPMLGHDYQLKKSFSATCETNSYELWVCTRDETHTENRKIGEVSKPKGHNYQLTQVDDTEMGGGNDTTFTWVCQTKEHDDTRDSLDKTLEITIEPATIQANTSMTVGDLADMMPQVDGGKLSLAEDEKLDAALTTDTKSVRVVFTPDEVKYADYTNVGAVSEFNNADLTLEVNVSKAKLDFSSVRFGNCLVGINPGEEVNVPITIERGNLPEDVKAGAPVYTEHGNKEGSTTPPSIGKSWTGTVSVTFTYDPKKYEEETKNLPAEYTYSQDPEAGTVTITHSYVVTKLEMTNVSATAIPDLAYTGSPMETVHVYGIPAGSTVSWEWVSKTDSSVTSMGSAENGNSPNLQIAEITNAGTYEVTITITNKSYETYTLPNPVTVTIQKAKIETPKPQKDLVYTSHKLIGLASPDANAKYSYQEGSKLVGVNAGTYTAMAVLTDTANYEWTESDDDGDGAVTISWNIAKRPVIETSINSAYKGQTTPFTGTPITAVSPPSSTPSGFFDVTYDDEGNLVGKIKGTGKVAFKISHAKETNAETYSVIASIEDFDNFCWQNHPEQKNVSLGTWTIGKLQINAPTINAEGATYTGEAYAGKVTLEHSEASDSRGSSQDIIDLDDTNIRYYTQPTGGNSGNAPVNAGTYYAGVESDGWAFVEGKVSTNYQIIRGARDPFSITKATAKMTFDEAEVPATYTAEGTALQPVTVTGLVEADKDKLASAVYTVTYTYKYRADDESEWENEEREITNPDTFVFTDVGQYQITAKWDAGTVSDNYQADPATYILTIMQADDQKITLTSAGTNEGQWNNEKNSYTTTYGSENTFTVTGKAALDNAEISYAVKGDSDVVSVDTGNGTVTIEQAGTATITVKAADTANVAGTSVDYTVTVNKAKPTVNTGLTDNKLEVSYTGKPITGYDIAEPTADVVEEAAPPTGDITYTFYTDAGCGDADKVTNGGGEGNIPIEVGTYYMQATYPGDKNYTFAESEVVTVTVTEAKLTVDANGYTGIYNGQPHDPVESIQVTGVDGVISPEKYTISYAKKTSDQPPEADGNWSSTLKVKDVAHSGDYWIKVVINGDDSSYAPYVGKDPITVTINPRPLKIERKVTARKPYNGTKEATVEFKTINTGVDGETVKVTDTRAEYNSPNVEHADTITITYQLTAEDGTNLANYSLDGKTVTPGEEMSETVDKVGDTKVGITPASITVAIKDQKKVYDGSAPTVSNAKDTDWKVTDGEIYQFVPDTDDDLGIILSIASGSKDAGAYAITGEWTNKNYDVTFTGSWTGGTAGTYTITPRPIKVEIGNAEGFYGDEPVKPSGLLSDNSTEDGEGLVEGDSLDQFLDRVVINASPNTDVGSHYTITGTSGEYGNYNVTFASGTYTVKQRPITITIKDHSSKYGAEIDGGIADPVSDKDYTVAITGNATTGDAIVNNDALTVTLETTASAKAAAGTYDITGSAEGEKVNNYAITWAGNGGDRDGGGKNGKYTIEEAELAISFEKGNQVLNGVSINITDSYNANPLVLKNASTNDVVSEADKETLGITYSIAEAGENGGSTNVATIDEKTGKVTIHSTGTVRVTATVTPQDSSNYTDTQTTWYELNIISGGQMAVNVTPKTNLAYTGDPQALLESASCSLDSAEIQYSLDNQDWQNTIPTGTNAGTYTVYVKATDPNSQYSDVTEHVTVTIAKADLKGSFAQEEYTHVLTKGNRYDSAQANPLTITSQNYKANPANYTYYSDNMQVASSANGTSTIVITGTAGESATIRVTVPGDNNYNEGTFTYTLEISDDLSKIEYSVGNQEVTYNGQPQTIAVKVSEPDSGATVMYWNEKASAYDLSEPPAYTDVQAGGYPIKFQITAPGYEAVTDEATLKIEPKDISQCKVEGIAESYTYVGHQIVPETVAVVDGSVILTKDTDYTLEYGANQEVGEGEGSVIIKGTGNYTGKVIEYFDIIPVDGSSGITASIAPNFGTYDPDAPVTAEVTVTHQTGSDSHDVDLTAANAKYTISATDLVTGQAITDHGATGTGGTLTFTKPAIYDITLTLTGDHQGEFRLSYTLLPLSNDDGGLTLTVDDETQKVFTYGDQILEEEATIKVTANSTDVTDQCTLTYEYTGFDQTTASGDYNSSVLENAGVYTVTATPKDGSAITGTGTFTFLILQRDLAKADLMVEDGSLVYNQTAQEPSVTVAVTGNPTADDYTITYYNNVNASNAAKAVVTATGNNFTGSKTAEFTISPKPIAKCAVENIPAQFYTGEPVIPPVTITDGNYTLILGYDYTTACADKGPGAATVTITGIGNYTETTTKDFVIKSEGAPEPSERFDLVVTPSQWTWGDDLTNLRLSVTFGTDKELQFGTDYTIKVDEKNFDGVSDSQEMEDVLSYIKGLKPGEYTITATGMDAYAGSTDTETVTIKKIQPTVTVTATPNSLSGGGKVTLTLKGEKLPNGTDLKTLLSVTAKNDDDVTLEDLHIQWPEDGSLTAELTLPNTNETYTFALRFAENEYYKPASSDAMVVVGQQTSGGGGGSDPGDQPADPDDTGVSDWLNTKDHLAYLAGYPGGTFGPDQNMTRAEAAQMFYNLLLEKDVEITVEFEDVPADAWYAKPVNTLASLGILSGVGNGRFDPERSITRAEFTVIAMKFANTSGGGVNIFSDVNEDDWFYSAVVDSTQYGWINGYPDGTFRPEATISRAEVTVIVNHMLGRAADRPYVIAHEEELNTFGDVNRGHWGYFHVAEATNAHEYHTEDGTESWTGLS